MANLWMGLGRLTKDPQTRVYGENNEKKMARFVIACDRRGKREEGQQTADFIPCVCYGKTADFADQYLRQGTKVLVTGSITTGKYEDKDGRTVYTTDILVNNVEFAESKRTADQGNQMQASTTPATVQTQVAKQDTSFIDVPDGVEESLPWE